MGTMEKTQVSKIIIKLFNVTLKYSDSHLCKVLGFLLEKKKAKCYL